MVALRCLLAYQGVDVMRAGRARRQVTRMGNKGTGGPFAPIVVVVKDAMGQKEFNKFRGKAISIHSGGAMRNLPPRPRCCTTPDVCVRTSPCTRSSHQTQSVTSRWCPESPITLHCSDSAAARPLEAISLCCQFARARSQGLKLQPDFCLPVPSATLCTLSSP